MIDAKIQHVTKGGANLFAELGFAPADAERYHAESQKRVNDAQALKMQLMDELTAWIKDNGLTQEGAAVILHVTRPRISDVVNRKVAKFSIDALVGMLTRIGKTVRLAVG